MVPLIAITPVVTPLNDSPAAGRFYSFMCTVTGADSLNPTINYQWFKTTPTRTQVGTNSPTLIFDPLVLSDAGQYNCVVTVSSTLILENVTVVSEKYDLKFSSKF